MKKIIKCKDGDLQVPEQMFMISGKVTEFVEDPKWQAWCAEQSMGVVFNKLQEFIWT